MVFYSRYYIQEMLLVCFTFGVIVCGYRYCRTHGGGLGGSGRGVRGTDARHEGDLHHRLRLDGTGPDADVRGHLARDSGAGRDPNAMFRVWEPTPSTRKTLHLVLGSAAALGVSALFYSSFFRHPQGVLDSYRAYATYFGRGAGEKTMHVHPWYYYLQMLVFVRYFSGPIWTEGWIVLLALVGVAAAVRGRVAARIDVRLVRFLALYTIVMTVVYSADSLQDALVPAELPAGHDPPGRRRAPRRSWRGPANPRLVPSWCRCWSSRWGTWPS